MSNRRAGSELDPTSLLEMNLEELLDSSAGEAIRAANVLDIAPKPANKTQPLSNTIRNPSNKRDLGWKRLDFEEVFIVRF